MHYDCEHFVAALANRIKELRMQRGWAQMQMVRDFGYYLSHWQNIESGRKMSLETMLRVANTFSTLRLARVVFAILGLTASATCLHAQAKPTASRAGDLQVGATFSLASPDYGPNTLPGVGAYATFDFRPHLGIEADFRQLKDPDSREGIYERNFEVGPRYVFRVGPLSRMQS